jgi:hypothetical protein
LTVPPLEPKTPPPKSAQRFLELESSAKPSPSLETRHAETDPDLDSGPGMPGCKGGASEEEGEAPPQGKQLSLGALFDRSEDLGTIRNFRDEVMGRGNIQLGEGPGFKPKKKKKRMAGRWTVSLILSFVVATFLRTSNDWSDSMERTH